MIDLTTSTKRRGHPIYMRTLQGLEDLASTQGLMSVIEGRHTGIVIRDALEPSLMESATNALQSSAQQNVWGSPNQGMIGGEIRTIGAAATPTFTSFTGPTTQDYLESAAQHAKWAKRIFGEYPIMPKLKSLFSALFDGLPASPPRFNDEHRWAPYNYRALDPGHQIYAHHDNHFALKIYDALSDEFDREILISWFVVLQTAEKGGALTLYGLWGSDPNPPMLPTRFLDIEVLERDYLKETIPLKAGDLVLFNSGKHVHRVSEVEGTRSRLTMGGFLTVDKARTKLAFLELIQSFWAAWVWRG